MTGSDNGSRSVMYKGKRFGGLSGFALHIANQNGWLGTGEKLHSWQLYNGTITLRYKGKIHSTYKATCKKYVYYIEEDNG
jgi:hypothetical protein